MDSYFNDFKSNIVDFKNWIIQPQEDVKLLRNNFLVYLLTFIIIILFTILFFYYSHNKIKFSLDTFLYTMLIIIPILLLFYYLKPQFTNINTVMDKTDDIILKTTQETSIVTIFITSIVVICLLIYFVMNVTPRQVLFTQYIFMILLGFIVIIGLAMIFLMFKHYFKTMSGWPGFFVRLVFFIPCLMIDFIQFIKNQMEITTNNVYILFILELLLILGYLYLPMIIKKATLSKGIVLLKDSRFLDKEYTITSDAIILPKKSKEDPLKYRHNFAISMWVYVNPQSTSFQSYSNETNIINMNNNKPRITYINNIDNIHEKDKIVIYFNDNKQIIKNKGQKWNNIVINCNSTIIDIFINGNLEKTFNLSEPLNYTNTGTITLGSNNGLDGAICNIMYYKQPLSKNEIANSYNLLMFNNPPIME